MTLSIVSFRLARYLRFWLLSLDGHSLQSPFLFHWYNNVLNRASINISGFKPIESLRYKLKQDHRTIELNTIGARSTLRSSTKLSSIASHGVTGSKNSRLLLSIIQELSAEHVLELGTSIGLNTAYMAMSTSVLEVDTVESNLVLCDLSKSHMAELNCSNVMVHHVSIDNFLNQALVSKRRYDFVFMDANHTFESTVRYFSMCTEIVSEQAIIVLDDINWSPAMKNAWQHIRRTYQQYLFIENYQFGIVFIASSDVRGSYILDF